MAHFEYDLGLGDEMMGEEAWTLFKQTKPMELDWRPAPLSPIFERDELGSENYFMYDKKKTEAMGRFLLTAVSEEEELDVLAEPGKPRKCIATISLVKPPRGWTPPVKYVKVQRQLIKSSCCVVNCGNTPQRCMGTGIKFHSFPGRAYEKTRKEMWIIAINRLNADGSLWRPTANSKVCSEHFVGGTVSNIANHPAYVPSIFPSRSKKPEHSSSQQKTTREAHDVIEL